MLQAFHLPGIPHPQTTQWSYPQGERQVELRVARLTPAEVREQVLALVTARETLLSSWPVARVVEALDAIAARLLDPADPVRRAAETGLPPITGASPPMVRRMLDGIAAGCRGAALRGLLRAELGEAEVLDALQPRGRAWGSTRAYGPRLATHLLGPGEPALAVATLVRSLLVKAGTLARTTVSDPLLPALFARAVHDVAPELGRCIAVAYWPAGDSALDGAALELAEAVTAAGPAEAIAAARARTPARARFIGYEPRVSFAVVAREALSSEDAAAVAAHAAMDVSAFDQHGCSAPHLVWVEEGGEVAPEEWAALLAREMERMERELPRGRVSPGEATAIRQQRAEAGSARGQGVVVHASPEGTAWTVIYQPSPELETSCRNRLVRVKPVAELEEVVALAAPVAVSLQTVGVAGPAERLRPLADRLGALGASRITPLGSMGWPPPTWHHDGRPPLRSLLRWCDYEE